MPAAIDITLIMVTIHIDTATIPIVTTPMATMGIMVTHALMVIMGYTDIPMAVITMVTHMGIATATATVMVSEDIAMEAIVLGGAAAIKSHSSHDVLHSPNAIFTGS